MRSALKWLVTVLGVLAVVVTGMFAVAWYQSSRAQARIFVVNDPALVMAGDAGSLDLGRHLFATRGCADCHGQQGQGQLVLDAGPVIRVVAPNLTPGGLIKGWTDDQVAAAIRHGVRADGTPLMFMPSGDFHEMSDADTAALVGFVKALPASNHDPGKSQVRPLGRVLYLLGQLPLFPAEVLDHRPRSRSAPVVAATPEYGQYLAQGCTGCHGRNFAGQHVPGTPPEFPDAANLTPTGLQGWTLADFRAALRTGKRPDGRILNELMPWRAFSSLKDEEIDALWAYLSTLPASP